MEMFTDLDLALLFIITVIYIGGRWQSYQLFKKAVRHLDHENDLLKPIKDIRKIAAQDLGIPYSLLYKSKGIPSKNESTPNKQKTDLE